MNVSLSERLRGNDLKSKLFKKPKSFGAFEETVQKNSKSIQIRVQFCNAMDYVTPDKKP